MSEEQQEKKNGKKPRFTRLLLLIAALVVGGVLGYWLLPEFAALKVCFFFVGCMILGEVFFRIRNKMSDK